MPRKKNTSVVGDEDDFEDVSKKMTFPAFAVPPSANDDLSLPPMDGEQFLRRVMEETKKCPQVVVVKYDGPQKNNQLIKLQEPKQCNKDLLPDRDWQLSTIADFSKLRLDMEQQRNKLDECYVRTLNTALENKDENEWLKIILNQAPDIASFPDGPSKKFCLALSQVKLWHLLTYFAKWLEDGDLLVNDASRWIFCLLACLDMPFPPDVDFRLRQIARTLINYRAQIQRPDSEELPPINLLVCIIGRYFHQTDLADPLIASS